MFVFMFIYSLLGIQFFGGTFDFGEEIKPRGNYGSFEISFFTVFQILTMENWQTVLYDTMRSDTPKIIPALYYITWIFVGNFILLNLFLAILLDSFLTEDDDMNSEEKEEAERIAMEAKIKARMKEKERRFKKLGASMFKSGNFKDIKEWREKERTKNFAALVTGKKDDVLIVDDVDDLDEKTIREIFSDDLGIIKDKEKIRAKAKSFTGVECNYSIYLFSKKNKFREWSYVLVQSSAFGNTILILIVLSSIKLAIDTYLTDYSKESTTY